MRRLKTSLLLLVFMPLLVGSARARPYLLGDLTGDCTVQWEDLRLFTEQWLDGAEWPYQDLVAYWKFDEGSQTTAYDSVGTNHGAINGAQWRNGKSAYALNFDSGGDYVDCGNDSSLDLTNNFSISVWVQLRQQFGFILNKGNVRGLLPGGAYTLYYSSVTPGAVTFEVRNSNNNGSQWLTITPFETEKWTHIVGTFSDGLLSIYKDGSFVESRNLNTPTIRTNSGHLGIGANGSGSLSINGKIDDVRIYNWALGSAEVAALYGCSGPACAELDGIIGVNALDFNLFAEGWFQTGTPLIINEFMASNGNTLKDGNGNSADWIEILNICNAPINIEGWYLTDSPGDLTEWRFPGPLQLDPGQFILVFASGADDMDYPYVDPNGYYHTNFKLGSDGEYLALVRPNGTVAHEYAPTFPPQQRDIPYGFYEKKERYFGTPTPEQQNEDPYLGIVADTQFSYNHGFYYSPISVALTCQTQDARIYYTLDGSEPTNASTRYTAPIVISETAYLRARAFLMDWLPGKACASTYIFPDQVIQQPGNPAGFPVFWDVNLPADYRMDPNVVNDPAYSATISDDLLSIPTMSLVIDIDDLFDPDTGIYTNTQEEGVDWERPASIELIYPDGPDGFQVNAGVRIYGRSGRFPQFKKHSFRLLFKTDYGPNKLRYALFGPDAADEFDTIILRANFSHTWFRVGDEPPFPSRRLLAQYLRDEFARATQLAMGRTSSHGMFVHLYLNGLYWGLYNPVERPSASFAATYFGGDKEDWDALNAGVPVDGDNEDWNTAVDIAYAGVADQSGYNALAQYVDIKNLIDYFIMNIYIGSNSWDGGNWYAAGNCSNGIPFKFFSWDAERSLESVTDNNSIGVANYSKPSWFYSRLRQNPEFRLQFADHVHRHFFNNGPLTPENTRNRYEQMADLIYGAIVGESARWGDVARSPAYTRDIEWLNERNRLLNDYFPYRTDVVLAQLRNANLYPDVNAPVFHINGSYQHGGMISPGDQLSMVAPAGTIYYTLNGSDPREPWTSNLVGIQYTSPVTLSNSTLVKARALTDANEWSALNEAAFVVGSVADSLPITEIIYHPLQELF